MFGNWNGWTLAAIAFVDLIDLLAEHQHRPMRNIAVAKLSAASRTLRTVTLNLKVHHSIVTNNSSNTFAHSVMIVLLKRSLKSYFYLGNYDESDGNSLCRDSVPVCMHDELWKCCLNQNASLVKHFSYSCDAIASLRSLLRSAPMDLPKHLVTEKSRPSWRVTDRMVTSLERAQDRKEQFRVLANRWTSALHDRNKRHFQDDRCIAVSWTEKIVWE